MQKHFEEAEELFLTYNDYILKRTDWASFRDYFTSLIIQNNSLDNLQRLHFLKSLLEGEAASLLKVISLTENNFVSAWDRLKDRFEIPRAIV